MRFCILQILERHCSMTCENTEGHIDFVAAHPAQSFQGLKAPQLGINQPATTCFRFLEGVLEEGLLLNVNSSMQTQPPLFVGKRYVMVDAHHPCTINEAYLVRAASIHWAGKDNQLPLLRQRMSADDSLLVLVDTRFARTKGTAFKEAFSSKVITDGKKVAWDQGEVLISIKPGETIDILYADGNVRSLVNTGGSIEVKNLNIEDVADIRVLYIRQSQARLRLELKGDQRTRAEDKLYHELVAVLAVGGKRSSTVFESVYKLLEDDGDRGLLGRGVQQHVLDALQHRPDYALRFKITCAKRGTVNETTSTLLPTVSANRPKGPPPERRAKLAARSQRDQAERQVRRGSSADMSHKGKSHKKK